MRFALLILVGSFASALTLQACQQPPKERRVRSAEDLEQQSSGAEKAKSKDYDDEGPFEQDRDM